MNRRRLKFFRGRHPARRIRVETKISRESEVLISAPPYTVAFPCPEERVDFGRGGADGRDRGRRRGQNGAFDSGGFAVPERRETRRLRGGRQNNRLLLPRHRLRRGRLTEGQPESGSNYDYAEKEGRSFHRVTVYSLPLRVSITEDPRRRGYTSSLPSRCIAGCMSMSARAAP